MHRPQQVAKFENSQLIVNMSILLHEEKEGYHAVTDSLYIQVTTPSIENEIIKISSLKLTYNHQVIQQTFPGDFVMTSNTLLPLTGRDIQKIGQWWGAIVNRKDKVVLNVDYKTLRKNGAFGDICALIERRSLLI
jgi:hypothetical protein